MTPPETSAKLRGWAANMAAVLLGFLIVAALTAAAEGVLRLKAQLSSDFRQPFLVQDGEGTILGESALSWELTRDGTVRCIAKWGEQLIYDVRGRTDAAGRRLTPCTVTTGNKAPVAAFFGCSMTFGQGVEDDETLPARFCARAPDWQAFNYGMCGYGPQHMWLQICQNDALREFSGRRGVVVYSFMDHHLERLVGTPSVLSSWTLFSLPWLESESGRIVHRGTFRDRSLIQDFYFRYVRRAHLTRFIENRLPSPKPVKGQQDAAMDLFVRLIVECDQAAKEQAPGLTFCCLVLPTCGGPWREEVLQRLEAAGVRVLDYEHLFEEAGLPEEELFFNDSPQGTKGHFKAPGYDLIARHLVGDVATPAVAPVGNAATPPAGG